MVFSVGINDSVIIPTAQHETQPEEVEELLITGKVFSAVL